MRPRIPSAPALLLLIATGCAGCARRPAPAASAEPAAIPAPLAAALMDDRNPTRATREFTVGALPSAFPSTLVPAGPVRIVGGMTAGDEIMVVFSDSTRRLTAVLEQQFEQAGFTRPAARPGSGFSPGSGPYTYFCKDSTSVSAEPLTGSDRNLARVSYRRMRGGNLCAPGPRGPRPSQEYLRLPALRPPPGVQVGGSGGGGGSDGVNSRGEISGTALVPGVIVAHYAAQLVAAGWTALEPAVSARVAAQFFEAKDASGATWEGVLMAAGSGTTISLTLNMQPRTKP